MNINLQNISDPDFVDSLYDEQEAEVRRKPAYWNGRKGVKKTYANARKRKAKEKRNLTRQYEREYGDYEDYE